MKQHNPIFGCRRIAMQINETFGLDIDKDVVWRILKKHYKPVSGNNGPSWLTFLGHTKDSLWSIDFFRCESILFKSHWVMVLMDQYTRRVNKDFGPEASVIKCWKGCEPLPTHGLH